MLAYWIAVSAVGFFAACSSLWRSHAFGKYLETASPYDLPLSPRTTREDLVRANRFEIISDAFLVCGLGANLTVGLAAAFAAQVPEASSVTALVTLIGLLGTGTLLAVYAVLNRWLSRA